MKSKTQVLARRRASADRLKKAEEAYRVAVGTADQARWLRRRRQLENEIGILDWVLDEKSPDTHMTAEDRAIIDEYGAFCNPKRFGE